MELWMEILAYTLPSLVVLAGVYVVMHKLYNNEQEKRIWELKKQSQKEITPTRLRAYERLALLLERTQPEHLVMEISRQSPLAEMSVAQLQQLILRTIRQEYDHNLSQQIYVSDELWDKIIDARDQMASFTTAMANQLPNGATTMDYAKVLMTAYNQNGMTPHEVAMSALKEEVKTILS